MGSRRAIYNDIAPKPRFFVVRGNQTRPHIYNKYTIFSVSLQKIIHYRTSTIIIEHAANTKLKTLSLALTYAVSD